jgi:uncharacterized OB-fold protein
VVNREFLPGIPPPYVVVLVDLEDADVRVVSNLIESGVEDVRIGMSVDTTFIDITAAATLALFVPRGDE